MNGPSPSQTDAPPGVSDARPPVPTRAIPLAIQLALLLAVCVCVYWLGLGRGGFFGTEGHRAIPAYEMLDHARGSGDWLVPHMFEQPYLRKPPGMPWAIAALSAVLGPTVFAARAVSALASTGMAFVAFGVARRWFGARAALPAGLASALMPVLWETGRAAEIEPLNHLGTQIAALFLMDALLVARSPRGRLLAGSGAAFGILWFALAKGPASAPVVIAVIAAVCVVSRSIKPLASIAWLPIIASIACIAGLGWLIARAASAAPIAPVTQSPGAFLFEPGMLLGVLTLPLIAFAQTLPASLAILFPWGPDARAEAHPDTPRADTPDLGWSPARFRIARALAVAWIIAVGLYMLFGVRNPRYTLPAAVLLPPLAGAYVAGASLVRGVSMRWLLPKRTRIARALLLGGPRVMLVVLLAAAGVYITTVEANRRATSATPTGEQIARTIAEWQADQPGTRGDAPLILVADGVVEARPELLLAVEREARRQGVDLRVRWLPGLAGGPSADLRLLAEDGLVLVLVRTDAQSGEAELAASAKRSPESGIWTEIPGVWTFHKYRAGLYLVDFRAD